MAACPVCERPDAHRRIGRTRSSGDPFRVVIGGGKPCAFAPVTKAREHDMARPRPVNRHGIQARAGQFETAQTLKGVAPPRPVIDPVPHRLAELTVAGKVDAELFLPPHHVGDGRSKLRLELSFIRVFSGGTYAVGFDQRIGARQAAGVTGQNAVVAGPHLFSPTNSFLAQNSRGGAYGKSIRALAANQRLQRYLEACKPAAALRYFAPDRAG